MFRYIKSRAIIFLMSKKITLLAAFLISFVFFSCSIVSKSDSKKESSDRTELGTTDSIFLNQSYIYESLDFALYNAWIKLDDALQSGGSEVKISLAQKEFLQELEKEKHIKSYKIENSMFGIQNQLADMEKACRNKDAQELSRLVTAFYISKGLIYQKSGTVFMQMIILMGALILLVLALLFFYQLTYARRIEIEKILKATNKGQEEERRRIAGVSQMTVESTFTICQPRE